MIRTYVDANLLITAFRGNDAGVAAALAVLDDARRIFVASAFLRLEILHKPLFYQRHDEVRFMEAFEDQAMTDRIRITLQQVGAGARGSGDVLGEHQPRVAKGAERL